MAADFGDLSTVLGLKALNTHLSTRSYISGHNASQDDIITIKNLNKSRTVCNNALSKNCTDASCAHVCRWHSHISSLTPLQISCLPKGTLKEPPAISKPSADNTTEDDFDLCNDDGGYNAANTKALAEKLKAEKLKAAKPKKNVIAKSSLVIEVKPQSIKTDLDKVCKMIKMIEIEGVSWGEAMKKVPLAFGLFKLQVSCVILDDVVTTEDITDRIEELGMSEEQIKTRRKKKDEEEEDEEEEEEVEEDDDAEDIGLVQSAEIVSFNKL